jgi:hypothetical protein
MSHFETPKVFHANPSVLKKRIFLVLGVGGAASVAWAWLTKNKTGNEPFFFAGGITAAIFAIRFYSMQVWGGAPKLTLDLQGITVGTEKSSRTVPWAEVVWIRYVADRSGHRWLIVPSAGESMEFYLDGLSHKQGEELREVITSLELPHVRVSPHYNPFEKAA